MKKKTLYILMSYYLIQGLLHNLGHVVTPVYVNRSGIPGYMFGFFFSAMSLGLFIGGPIWGILGDWKRKKPFIVLGLLGYSIGQVLFVSTTHLVWMTVFRFVSGFSVSAAVTLLLSELVRVSDDTNRTKNLSISAALFALGTTLGYAIGGWMGTWFIREVFYIQAVTNALYAGYVWFSFRESREPVDGTHASFFKSLRHAATLKPSLWIFLFALTLATTAATIVQRYLDVYVTVDLARSTSDLGNLVLVTGLVGMATNFLIVPVLTRWRRDFAFMQWIQVASAIIIFIVFRSERIIVALYTGYMFYIVLKSIYQPLEQNYISLNAQSERYSSIMGVRQAFFAMGMVIGPLFSGWIYDANPIRVFDVSAFMFLLSFLLLLMSRRALRRENLDVPTTATHHLDTAEIKAAP